jgi:pimeloyl-ACP methyl ester carboxylesterase
MPVGEASPFRVEPFSVRVDAAVIDDLRARIRNTRLPEAASGEPWAQGIDRDWLAGLLEYWAERFDWLAAERELNGFAQYRAQIGEAVVHFAHERARHGGGIPLVLGHGWPSAFAELLPVARLLADPGAHGIDGPAFDVVVPSLPGYGFSPRPAVAGGVTYRYVAALWHRLMRGLGYARYGAGGGDFGSGIATFMALDDPGPLIGLHLTNLELAPYTGPGSRPLSGHERDYLQQSRWWDETERGYTAIQSTKPQTLGYALNDSPAGLAAWILEKWRSWSDCGGDLDSRFSRDFLLSMVTLYWVTGTITSSMRDYFDNRRWQGEPRLRPGDIVRVPTAVAVFPHTLVPEGQPPREWAERLYDIRRWTVMPRGGHFAPAEEPELVARDIAAFFATLDRS